MFFLLTQTAEAHEEAHLELVNWIQLVAESFAPSGFSDFLVRWEKVIFSAIVGSVISLFVFSVFRRLERVPSHRQLLLEHVVTSLDGLVCGVLGPEGRAHTPFVGSLFIYILVSNLFGLIPLQASTTSFITTTAPLAICVFFYVQWLGITKNGIVGYFYHMAGSPKDAFGWVLVPLNLPLHILGEFVKPLSLSFRLYGNTMAGHILLGVFVMLGIKLLSPLHIPVGAPLHFPFMFLEIMVGLIQAFVFTLLSTVYIAMMLPHEHEEHGEQHAGEPASTAGGHAHA